jgi:periplasmic protein TonB
MQSPVFLLLFAALTLFVGPVCAQTAPTTIIHPPKTTAAPGTPNPRPSPMRGGGRPDVPCHFPGPPNALGNFIRENLQYPAAAADHRVSGKLTVQFMVQADGSLTDFSIIDDSLGYGCEAEALRVAKLMPNWVPAKRRNQPVPTTTLLTLPFGATPVLDDPKNRHQLR